MINKKADHKQESQQNGRFVCEEEKGTLKDRSISGVFPFLNIPPYFLESRINISNLFFNICQET